MRRIHPEDIIGQTYGNLLVMSLAGHESDGHKRYECRCSCGNTTVVTGKNLRSGNTRSCGCIRKTKSYSKDMIGLRFGRLTVTERAGTAKSRTALWKCMCDCGSECIVSGSYLRQGDTKSCGCLQREGASKRARKNILGMSFGKLTVRQEHQQGVKFPGEVLWECECECGTMCIVSTENLIGGNTKSCGCMLSNGERILHQ